MAEPATELSDEELLSAAAKSPDAFAAFYDRHVAKVLGTLRQRVELEVAYDITAEVFATALERAGRFRPSGNGSAVAWVFGIARNKLADYYRTLSIDQRALNKLGIELRSLSEDDIAALEQRLDEENAPLVAALEDLPEHERDAITRHVLDEHPYRDLARQMELPEATVRKRVSRGLGRLRSTMEKEDDR